MDIAFFTQIVQVVSAVVLIILILMQKSEAGVGGAFGGGDSETSVAKRRGPERIIFGLTILVVVIFLASVILPIL